ncbi:hypothetical protein ANCDUO_15657 [Ancylostoma duodenale]|uniref:Zinc knuckle n=1 Tax=Ancylostoma duodenale TaxID=51022 RepID=A0A0C2CCZ2_9BILA|nr:hypothetical protein ANCDUO_15657 [Ancylostoma duodenale]
MHAINTVQLRTAKQSFGNVTGLPQKVDERAPIEEGEPVPDEDSDEAALRRIQREMNHARQALHDFEMIIKQLRDQPTCAPRRFERGNIRKSEECNMRCAFCEAIGVHYSDSCTTIVREAQRKEVLIQRSKCEMCLERYCMRGAHCRKYMTRCFHCRGYGHHSAICDLPERSPEIIQRLDHAREAREGCLRKLELLERELHIYRH